MDADYYMVGGISLTSQKGFWEPILWNYLDNPSGLPHPSHAYWMPLASILAAAGMALTRQFNIHGAQAGMIVLGASISPLTAYLSFKLNHERWSAWFSGGLAIASGFYLAYLPTTDTFGVYMLLGTSLLLLVPTQNPSRLIALLLPWLVGILAGLMHLARADGLLWLVIAVVVVVLLPGKALRGKGFPVRLLAFRIMACLTGYLMIMAPWMARNYLVFGSWLSPAGSKVLWLTDYDDLYIYPASLLTLQRWIGQGLMPILTARLYAVGQNIQTFLAVQGEIILVPLIIAGLWRLRQDRRVQVGIGAWLLTVFVMTIIFPLQGARGGFFHSGAALQPLFWAVTPAGLLRFIEWGGRYRNWREKEAIIVFQLGILFLLVILSGFLVYQRVVKPAGAANMWDAPLEFYQGVNKALDRASTDTTQRVMVNNPPGFFLASGRQAIAIPDGGVDTLIDAAMRFHTCILILESNHPVGLEELYRTPEQYQQLIRIGSYEDAFIYWIKPCSPVVADS